MTNEKFPLWAYLVERWRLSIFQKKIYPDFPFRPSGWVSVAFNRDNHGDMRLPDWAWRELIALASGITEEKYAFVASTDPLLGGVVEEHVQPYAIALTEDGIAEYFKNHEKYLPSFYMAGASERWGIWGDSDITVLGGQANVMSRFMAVCGGADGAIDMMCKDFLVKKPDDRSGMLDYFFRLARGTRI